MGKRNGKDFRLLRCYKNACNDAIRALHDDLESACRFSPFAPKGQLNADIKLRPSFVGQANLRPYAGLKQLLGNAKSRNNKYQIVGAVPS